MKTPKEWLDAINNVRPIDLSEEEIKAIQADAREFGPVTFMSSPMVIEKRECSHIVRSKTTCTCCWHCPKCGRRGCSNLAGYQNYVTERVICHQSEPAV